MHETQKNFVKRTKAADHRWRRRRAPLSRRLCTTSLHWTDRRSWEVCRYLSRTKQDLSDRSHHSSYLISLGSSSEVELNWIELSWAGLGWIRTPAAQFRWDEMRWDQLEPRKHGFNVRPDIFFHRRCTAERGGCFQQKSLCGFFRLFVNKITSERLNIGWWNLVGRCIVYKSNYRVRISRS